MTGMKLLPIIGGGVPVLAQLVVVAADNVRVKADHRVADSLVRVNMSMAGKFRQLGPDRPQRVALCAAYAAEDGGDTAVEFDFTTTPCSVISYTDCSLRHTTDHHGVIRQKIVQRGGSLRSITTQHPVEGQPQIVDNTQADGGTILNMAQQVVRFANGTSEQ